MNLKPAFHNVIILFLIIFIFSCKNDIETIIQTRELDISNIDYEINEVYLSEIADSIEYIKLETDSSFYTADIEEIKFSPNYILILSKELNKVFLFDKNGKFLTYISSIGKGPGEYIEASLIEISEDEKSFYLNTYNRETIVNNASGEYLKTIKFEPYARYFFTLGNNLILYTMYPTSIYNDDYAFTVYTDNGKLAAKMSQKKIPWGKKGDVGSYKSSYKINDTVNVWEYYFDTIYGVSRDLKVTPRWIIKYDNNYVDKRVFQNRRFNKYLYAGSKKYMLYSFVESENHFFLIMNRGINRYSVLYNKNEKRGIAVGQNSYFFGGSGFINDLDGGYPFWPRGIIDNKTLYAIIRPDELKYYINNSDTLNNVKIKFPEKQKVLENMVNNLSKNDNQIIIKVHLK